MSFSKVAHDVIAAFGDIITRLEMKICQEMPNKGITVREGGPLIVRMHLRHMVSSHLALISTLDGRGLGPLDIQVYDELYDHESFMALVDREVRYAIKLKRDECTGDDHEETSH